MLKSILGTAALLVGWSVLWFVNVVFLGAGVRDISACPNGGCQVDDGLRDILVWVIGIVAIVAVRVWLYRRRSV